MTRGRSTDEWTCCGCGARFVVWEQTKQHEARCPLVPQADDREGVVVGRVD